MPTQINLDELIDPSLSVVLDGQEVPVLPVDAICYRLLANTKQGGVEAIEAMYQAAIRCLPSLSEERVLRLTAAQANAVVSLASQDVGKVEAVAAPNSAPGGRKPKPAKV